MHCFSNLFDKVLYMFRTGPLSIIRIISTLYTQQWVFVMLVMLTVCQRGQDFILTSLADSNIISMTNTYCCVYSVEILLMMDSGPVRNM